MQRAVFASLVISATVLGCTTSPDEQDEPHVLRPGPATGATGDAIRGGYVAPNDKAAVGIVALAGGGLGICSGSLLAPNLVLTARHCVSSVLGGNQGVICGSTSFSAPYSADSFFVTTNGQMTQDPSDYHAVREVLTLPVDDLLCGQDIAVLILDANVDASEAVPYAARIDSPLVAGEEYYAVGFGETNDGQGDSGLRRRRDALFVGCVEELCDEYGVLDTEWVGDQGICSGDSGGPALDLQNRVVGVTSRGAQGCMFPVYGSVHGWGQWLKEAAIYASQLGGYTVPAWANPVDPTGQPCTSPAECSSNVCLNGYCTRSCDDTTPCPAGFTCTDAGQGPQCVQNPPPDPATSSSGGGESDEDDEDDEDGESEDDEKSARSSDSAAADDGGCSFSGRDPVTPVPWLVGLGFVGAAIARRRRR